MAVLFGTMLVLTACGGAGDNDTQEPADTNDEGTEESADDGGAEDSTDDGGTVDTAAAEDLYRSSCASCHGEDLSGGAGPALENVGSDMSADEIKDIIENGQGSMPAGLLSGDDADAVAEWLAEHN